MEIDYLADNQVFPYGELPDDILLHRLRAVIGTAIELLRPDAVVVACNTASTIGLSALRSWFDLPFVGCVPPIKWAGEISRTRVVGLLATAATVRRPYLRALRERFAPDCTLLAHGARGLADLAEAAFRGHVPDGPALRREVAALFEQDGGERIDAVGIGCTHYSFLMDALVRASPRPVRWLDPAGAVARQALAVLDARTHVGPGPATGTASSDRAGRAFFTATPFEPDRVAAGLARFGYRDGFLPFRITGLVSAGAADGVGGDGGEQVAYLAGGEDRQRLAGP